MEPNIQQSREENRLISNPVFNQTMLRKISVVMMLGYLALSVLFYFLAGRQLHFRQSRENISMPTPNSGSVEIVTGNQVEQTFINKIQRLTSISVAWGTYGRSNSGTVFVDLYELNGNTQLLHQELSAAEITEGFVSLITLEQPKEGLYGVPLLLRITADSNIGSALSPLMNTAAVEDGFQLYLNGQPASGMLCFSVQGEEYIWTGLHYWKFVAGGAILLVLYLWTTLRYVKKGKKPLILMAFIAIRKYRFLIQQLVARDFKAKYKRSVLGVLWSLLNPLLTMIVQYLVFSSLFRFDIPYYTVYLLCGIVMFNYFSEACGMTLGAIVGNANLITKVYVPKYIYPLTRVISSFINLLIAMVPLFIVAFVSGLHPTKAYFLLPFVLVCLAVLCLGLGMLLAAAMVFFRDMQFLWGVISMIWMYLTPIFYPESILPSNVAMLLKGNPLYYFIKFVRTCVIDGVSPELIIYVQCFLFAIGFLALGAFVFKRTQDRFVLYL
ncbi:ABC transporter permease [Oscillospiraceae bacterium MB08-C2-2]|nr:ABC transporter permease [Oscillospiraceae bacterium MB08-C2-2]